MNPFYQSFQKNQNGQPAVNLPKNPQELMSFLTANHITPEQKVRELLQSRAMTQEQFEAYAAQANKLLGRNK